MKSIISTLVLILFIFQSGWTCSCIHIETFCETITYNDGNIDPNTLIVLVRKNQNNSIGMEVEIMDILHGNLTDSKIDIRKGNGADCGVNTDIFDNGQELLLALWPWEHQGVTQYQISICGINFLEVNNGIVEGAIAPGVNNLPYDELTNLNGCGELIPGFINIDAILFPNPATSHTSFVLDTNGPISINATIYDTMGRRLVARRFELDENTNNADIPTNQLPGGVYFVEIRVLSSKKTYKLVVSK